MENNTINVSSNQTIISPDNSRKPMWLKNATYWIVQAAKKQLVLTIAIIAMLITCFLVPVDAHYLDYFNWATLATLYCTLAVVEALANIHVFEIISRSIVLRLRNLRNATFGLVFITFIGSMFLANDMALLTFLPLGYFVLTSTDNKQAMAFTFIMQNIAANLGGMITPFGNPQNLYLYAFYNIGTMEFMKIMFPSFITSTLLIIGLCCFVKPIPLKLKGDSQHTLNLPLTISYTILFVASILMVFRVIPYLIGTILVTLILFIMDRNSLRKVNYPLLATFAVFFIFSGNMARIPAVNAFFSQVLPINTLLFGILSCQIISNVPSAVLLSHFTDNYHALLPAVNIGGSGTLIASLASLITFSEFKKHNPNLVKSYLTKFTLINFLFIIILYLLEVWV